MGSFTTATAGGITTASATVTGLVANTAYKVKITAQGTGNYTNSDPSPLSASITTNKSAATPTATTPSVSNSGVANVGSTAVLSSTASCSDSASALCGVGYTYQWQYLDGSTWSNVTDGSGADTPNYTTRVLALVDNGIQYRLGVTTSKNGTSATGYSAAAAVSVAQIKLGTPSTPTGVAVDNLTTSISISTTAVANTNNGYSALIYQSDGTTAVSGATVGSFTTATAGGITTASATVSGLAPGTAYKVKITAQGTGNYSNSDPSPLSAAITTNKAAQSTPSVTTIGATSGVLKSLTVSWGAISTATSYTVKLRDSSGNTVLATITDLSGTSTTITASNYAGFADTTGYRVSVIAQDNTQYLVSAESSVSDLATTLSGQATAPTIGTHPVALNKSATQVATFSVAATVSDAGALSYQWQLCVDGSCANDGAWTSIGTSSNSYATAALTTASNGYKYRVIVTNTLAGTTASTTSNTASLGVVKINQSALTLTSVAGLLGVALPLTTSGGSSSGALTYAVSNGTATSCSITSGVLSTGTAGTCRITVTKAGDSDTYNNVVTSATTVTIQTNASSIAVTVVSTAVYQTETTITVAVGTKGIVEFLQNGRTIKECSFKVAVTSRAATCEWKPSTLGETKVWAVLTPTNQALVPVTSPMKVVTVTARP